VPHEPRLGAQFKPDQGNREPAVKTAQELAQRAEDFRKIIDAHLPKPSPMIKISPDHTRIGHEVMWGGIWKEPGLELRLRSIATITAQCVNGHDFGLCHQIRVGLTLGISPQKIKAMFVELKFYAGVPASVFALLRAQEVINEREEWKAQDQPLDAPWLATLDEKMQRGRELRREHWGGQADRELAGSITHEMVPESAQIVDSYLYGEIWARSPLDAKERMVLVLSVLACRQHFQQLRRHIGYALDAGLNPREICEVFAQAGWYRGWPHVEDALIVAKEVFAERGV
jgi:4-carboxymuconolactone decarboxylase